MNELKKIIESEKKLITIFDALEDAIILFDEGNRIQWYNKTAENRLSSVLKKPLEKGMKLQEFLPENVRVAFYEDFKKSLNGDVIKFERIMLNEDEKKFSFFVTMHPIYDENKNVIGVLFISKDITEYKLAELEKDKIAKEIVERSKEMEQFSFITSHELRHEFSKMLINDAKLSDNLNDELKDFFVEIDIAATNINNVIAELNKKINTLQFQQKSSSQFPPITSVEEICLLDDDALFNRLNERIISNTYPGIPIMIFENADSALEHVRANPSVSRYIFLDLNMQNKSGWDFLDEYSNIESKKDSPVIILSSSIDPVEQKRSEGYKEVLNFFTKPLYKNLLELLR